MHCNKRIADSRIVTKRSGHFVPIALIGLGKFYIVYVHLISLRGILLYKIHYNICLSFRATCKGLLKHGIEKEEECSVNIKPYEAKFISYLVIFQNQREEFLLPFQ